MKTKRQMLFLRFGMALIVCLGSVQIAQAWDGFYYCGFWVFEQGTPDETSNAAWLGNNGADNGSISILSTDGQVTLTITAVGCSEDIILSAEGGLSVADTGGTGPIDGIGGPDRWWQDGEWIDLQFSLAGPADLLFLDGAAMNWFNEDNNVPLDTGEKLLVLDMTAGGMLLGDIDDAQITSVIDDEAMVTGLGIPLPLGHTIRFEADNTPGDWPQDSWVTKQWVFEAKPVPEPSTLTLAGLACAFAVAITLRRRFDQVARGG